MKKNRNRTKPNVTDEEFEMDAETAYDMGDRGEPNNAEKSLSGNDSPSKKRKSDTKHKG